jgi:hypothetical protein
MDALQVGGVIIGSLGGGGAIVFGLSGVLGKIWVDRLRGEIDKDLRRLDRTLEHGNFLLRRAAEFELEALTETWRAARVCLPLINATRPVDSGKDLAALTRNTALLSDAHNALVETLGRHEPFLPDDIAITLDEIRKAVAQELHQIQHQQPFANKWWEEGAANQAAVKTRSDALLVQVRSRNRLLREDAERSR